MKWQVCEDAKGPSDGDQRELDHKKEVITNESKRVSEMFHNCALNK